MNYINDDCPQRRKEGGGIGTMKKEKENTKKRRFLL